MKQYQKKNVNMEREFDPYVPIKKFMKKLIKREYHNAILCCMLVVCLLAGMIHSSASNVEASSVNSDIANSAVIDENVPVLSSVDFISQYYNAEKPKFIHEIFMNRVMGDLFPISNNIELETLKTEPENNDDNVELVEVSELEEPEEEVVEETVDDVPTTNKTKVKEKKTENPDPAPEPTISYRYNITNEEFEIFCRIVEAEVTGKYYYESKLRVAQVILNRVASNQFPSTVQGVVFQRNQFSPLIDGRYYSVEITDTTRNAVRAALLSSTDDMTQGALYFSSGTTHCAYGYLLFTDEVGHSFFYSYK